MRSFAQRRTVNIGMTALAAAALLSVWFIRRGTLRADGFLSGWALLGLIAFLAAYNIRKALPFLPLGSSTAWLQLHIYGGLLTLLMFGIHVDFAVPNGPFDVALALLYLGVFLSGLIGLFMTRTYPRRLTTLGNEVVFEHIPVARRHLQQEIETLVLECNAEGGTSAIPDFYRERVRPFVVRRPDVLSHLIRGSSRRFHLLMQAMADQDRYLNDHERSVLARLKSLLQRKHQLDTQYALQSALKGWLFVHIPLTYALLIVAVFHSILVHAWSGGLT